MNIDELDKTKCIYCDQPFHHTTRERKVKGTDVKEIRLVLGHPKCEQLNKKVQRTKKQIQKVQVKLSELRMCLVGLNYEEFLNKTKSENDDDDNCVVAILKAKDIL